MIRLHFLFQSRLVPTGEDEFADEISRPPGGCTQRETETNEIFGVRHIRLESGPPLPLQTQMILMKPIIITFVA